MLPRDLKPEHFLSYPPEARRLAANYLGAFQTLPLSFLPNLLREVADYDYKFPIERRALEKELRNLASLSAEHRTQWFGGFAAIQISHKLEDFDWAASPAQFVEQLSEYLWSTHQLDAFRAAAVHYATLLQQAVPAEPPAMPRLGITVIGEGIASYDQILFRKLRPHGAYFSKIDPEHGLARLMDTVGERARNHPEKYGHWYIDGGNPLAHDVPLTVVSYTLLEPVRRELLKKIDAQTKRPGMGPEALRTTLAQMQPSDLGFVGKDAVLDRFQMKILTEGSGTQIFSTSFIQWAAREALRRAQPLTLLVRFAPRQRQKPMNELLSANPGAAEPDPVGSLIDGDMGAYYNWLNQQRLPGAEQSSFLVWFEGHNQALMAGPSVPRGTESTSEMNLKQLLNWQG